MKKITCLICARGGSKGLKNKNIKKFHGKPLIEWTFKIAKASIKFFKYYFINRLTKNCKNSKKKSYRSTFFKTKKFSKR